MPKVPVENVELYYEIHGSGPTVVFAHGMGGNHLSWWQQVPVFAQKYQCLIFDHRGWGQSTDIHTGPAYHKFANDLRLALDRLAIDQVMLVAQSMGGLTCLGFALAYPERTRALVLGGTTGGIGDASVVDPLRAYWARNDRPPGPVGPTFMKSDPARTYLYREINALNPRRPYHTEVLDAFVNGQGPKATDLARLSMPTLLLSGTEDHLFSPGIMEAASKLIPGSRQEVVSEAGHSVYFEKPEVFNSLVMSFLDQHAG